MSKKKRASLAQTRRDDLLERVKQRGKKTSNIWYVFCPGMRTDVILVGDLRLELFFATEGDPGVVEATYENEPVPLRLGDADEQVRFDAIVRFADGHRECRDARYRSLEYPSTPGGGFLLGLKKAAAESIGARYLEFTTTELDAVQQRVRNWARATAALARCRDASLEIIEFELMARLANGGRHTIGQLLSVFAEDPPALVVAAIVSLVRKHELLSDLDSHTWGMRTSIWREVSP